MFSSDQLFRPLSRYFTGGGDFFSLSLGSLSQRQGLALYECTDLTNVDGLKNLSALQSVDLRRSTGLTKATIAALKEELPNTNSAETSFPGIPEL